MPNQKTKLDNGCENIGGKKEESQDVNNTVSNGKGIVTGIISRIQGMDEILKSGHVIYQSDMGIIISHDGIYHCISYEKGSHGIFFDTKNYLKIKRKDKDDKINTWEKDKYDLPSKEDIDFLLGILSGDPDNFAKLGFQKGGKYLLSGNGYSFADGHVFHFVSLEEAKSGKNYLIDGFSDQEYNIRELA